MTINKFGKRILLFILIIDLFMAVFIMAYPKEIIGWILGSLGSMGNFFWLTHLTGKISVNENESKLKIVKGFYFRFVALIAYAFLVVYFIRPNIVAFGLGLLSAQFVIYLDNLFRSIKSKN